MHTLIRTIEFARRIYFHPISVGKNSSLADSILVIVQTPPLLAALFYTLTVHLISKCGGYSRRVKTTKKKKKKRSSLLRQERKCEDACCTRCVFHEEQEQRVWYKRRGVVVGGRQVKTAFIPPRSRRSLHRR
jgi:hypothetical protein